MEYFKWCSCSMQSRSAACEILLLDPQIHFTHMRFIYKQRKHNPELFLHFLRNNFAITYELQYFRRNRWDGDWYQSMKLWSKFMSVFWFLLTVCKLARNTLWSQIVILNLFQMFSTDETRFILCIDDDPQSVTHRAARKKKRDEKERR